MDSVYKFNSQLEARDKVFRLIQYGTRLLWSLRQGTTGGQVDELKKIESAISFSRQMLRFGKFLESLNAALRSVHLQDAFLRTTLSLAQIADGLYLLCDHFVWLSKLGVIKVNEERFAVMGDSYWLYSTLLLLAKHLYQMQIIWANAPLRSFDSVAYQHHLQVSSNKRSSSNSNFETSTDGSYSAYLRHRTSATARHLLHFAMVNRSLTLEVLKNLCDAVISMNASRKVAFSPFTVGFVGVISSLIPLLKYKTLGVC